MHRLLKASTGALIGALLGPLFAMAAPSVARADTGTPTGFVQGLSRVIPVLTTASSQTYLNPDGSRTLIAYNAPVRYKDPSTGTWTSFDLTATQLTDGTLGAKALPAGVHLDASTGTATLTTPTGPIVVSHVGAIPSTVATNDRVAMWKGLFGDDRTLTESLQTNGAEESVILPTSVDPSTYTDEITLPTGVTVQSSSDGIRFVDAAGNIVGGFGGAFAIDANQHEGPVSIRLVSNVGSSATISVTIDPTWLATAAFPVTIDPTLFSQDLNQVDTYLNSDNCGANYYYEQTLRVGSDGAGPNACAFAGVGASDVSRAARIFLHFSDVDSIAVPGTVVTKALLSMDQTYAADTVNNKGYEIWNTASKPTSSMNWSNQSQQEALVSNPATWHADGWVFPDVTGAAAAWVQGPQYNTGLEISADGEYVDKASLKEFYSVNAGIYNGPNLAVTFTPPPSIRSASLLTPDAWRAAGSPVGQVSLQAGQARATYQQDVIARRNTAFASPAASGTTLSTPPASSSHYERNTDLNSTSSNVSSSNQVFEDGARDPSPVNQGTLGVFLEVGGLCSNNTSVGTYASPYVCVDDYTVTNDLEWYLFGYWQNTAHRTGGFVDVMPTINNNLYGNAAATDYWFNAVQQDYYYASYINDWEVQNDNSNLIFQVDGGYDVEPGFGTPAVTMPVVNEWSADSGNSNAATNPFLYLTNNGAYFSSCNVSSCWDSSVAGNGWSPHQIYEASGGGAVYNAYGAGLVFPEMYDNTWGTYWADLNQAADSVSPQSDIAFLGVLAGCGVAGQTETTTTGAYADFSTQTHQSPYYLSLMHAQTRSC